LERVDPRQLRTICIFNANVSFPDLLKTILQEFDLDSSPGDPFILVDHLHKVLIHEFQQGHNIALIIDEAQNMPVETLEHLRMLSNLETATQKLLQIVLIGQPELDHKLNVYELRQLKQRIVIRATLAPLTAEESIAYIHHRLAKATLTDDPIFTDTALNLLVKAAKGTPRVLNTLCTNALIVGFGSQQRPVSRQVAREVIADFQGKRQGMPWLRKLLYVVATLLLTLLLAVWFAPETYFGLTRFKSVEALYDLFSHRSNAHRDDATPPAPAGPLLHKEQVSAAAGPPVLLATEIPVAQDQTKIVDQTWYHDMVSKSVEEDQTDIDNHLVQDASKTITSSTSSFPRVIFLQPGDSISKIALEIYGFVNSQLLEKIKRQNPHIKNIDKVGVGEEILFPTLSGEKTS
jgi:general secretion pathway protein A